MHGKLDLWRAGKALMVLTSLLNCLMKFEGYKDLIATSENCGSSICQVDTHTQKKIEVALAQVL